MKASVRYQRSSKDVLLTLLKHHRGFQAGLMLKLIIGTVFASAYLTDLFCPFIRSALNDSFWQVYSNVYPVKPNAFPYPPVMLYLLSAARFIGSVIIPASGPVSFADLFLIRLPLLFGDLIVLLVLIKWLRNTKAVVTWYWFNPIVVYITYVHGQLDILPTAFLCLSLYYLFTNRFYLFAVFLAVACATKFHIVLAIPLLVIYIYRIKQLDNKVMLRGALLFVGLLFALNCPFIFQDGYIKMVYQNAEQNKVLESFFNLFDSYRLIFVPAAYMVILYLMFELKFINKDILLIFLALSFGIITFFIVPSQGWYLWNMPFFIYFVIRFSAQEKYLFLLLNINYFLFFLISPKSDIPQVAQLFVTGAENAGNLYNVLQAKGIDADVVLQIMFTLLQTILLLFCISLFRLGILQIRKYKIYSQPYLIGICGDSASGKSTLSDSITALLGGRNTLVLKGDDMHRWERGHQKWEEYTHLDPKANWLHRDLADLTELKAGKKIQRRSYDHTTGKFTSPAAVKSRRVIIYEGLHAFYLREVSNIYDLKIFMNPSDELRRYWKIDRDVNRRGHQYQDVVDAIDKRVPDAVSHIVDQQAEADIIFSIIKADTDANNDTDNNEKFALKVTCANDIYFEELLDGLKDLAGSTVVHTIDRYKQVMTLHGDISIEQVQDVADSLRLNVEELMGNAPVLQSNFHGVMQLFVLYYIFNNLKKTGVLPDQEAF